MCISFSWKCENNEMEQDDTTEDNGRQREVKQKDPTIKQIRAQQSEKEEEEKSSSESLVCK